MNDLSKLSREELVKIVEAKQAELKKRSKASGVSAKTEDDFVTSDRCHFVPGSLRKAEDSNKNVVDAICMWPTEDGDHELDRDFRPVFRKPSPRAGEVNEVLAVDAGTTVCGATHTRATSDLHHAFYCTECKSKANAARRESRSEYNTQVKAKLTSEIAELQALINAKEGSDDDIILD